MAMGQKLRVFVSSKMVELRDVRQIVKKALEEKNIDAWVFEFDAGARPEGIVQTSLREVEAADLYVGLFWEKYGAVTVQEYRHARMLGKPCFVYLRGKGIQREDKLERFLQDEVCDLQGGVTYDFFDSAIELGEQVARDIEAWLTRQALEAAAQNQKPGIALPSTFGQLLDVIYKLEQTDVDDFCARHNINPARFPTTPPRARAQALFKYISARSSLWVQFYSWLEEKDPYLYDQLPQPPP